MNAWAWIAGYVMLAIGCFALLVITGRASSRTNGGATPATPPAIGRLAVIVAALLAMAVIGWDLQRRIQTAQILPDGAVEDRDTPDEATLEGQLIEGPDVVALYFRQGYAWAATHSVKAAAGCPADNRAYRDGCRAFVAGVR